MDSRGKIKDNDIYWKGPNNMYTFRFKEITHVDVEQYFFPSVLKLTMIYLILISGVSNMQLLLFLNLFRKLSMIPYLKGRVHTDWKRARVSPVYKGEGDLDFEGSYY